MSFIKTIKNLYSYKRLPVSLLHRATAKMSLEGNFFWHVADAYADLLLCSLTVFSSNACVLHCSLGPRTDWAPFSYPYEWAHVRPAIMNRKLLSSSSYFCLCLPHHSHRTSWGTYWYSAGTLNAMQIIMTQNDSIHKTIHENRHTFKKRHVHLSIAMQVR